VRYLTVADQPVAEQFDYWRDVICQVCTPLAAERDPEHRGGEPGERGMTGWVRSSALGSSYCAEVCSRTQSLTHGPPEIRRMSSDDVFVSLQLRGHCIAGQGERTCHLPPGGFALFDTTDTYRLTYQGDRSGEWQVISFRVPRARLMPFVADPGGFTALTHDATRGGIAAMVAATMTSIWHNVESLDDLAAQAAETALLTLLAAAAGDTVDHREVRRETVVVALRASVNRYLAGNLHQDLSAAMVAGHFGIPVRKLHGLYQHTDRSFAQTVMALRVEACARDLASGPGRRTLTDTATRWGFADLSHMNRRIRARFGCLPSELRGAAFRSAIRDGSPSWPGAWTWPRECATAAAQGTRSSSLRHQPVGAGSDRRRQPASSARAVRRRVRSRYLPAMPREALMPKAWRSIRVVATRVSVSLIVALSTIARAIGSLRSRTVS
jgi:AraC-like DNA-binding protein